MSSSSESEYFSQESDNDLTASENDLDDLNINLEDLQIQPHQFEPEKVFSINDKSTENEKIEIEKTQNENMTEERTGNVTWCDCSNCSET